MKITLIQSNPVSFKGQKGEDIEGYQNAGYIEDGSLLEFWGTTSHEGDVVVVRGYTEEYAIDVKLTPKVFKGNVKYREN